DTFLLRRAAAAGAVVREGARVRRLACAPGGVTVETDDDAVTASLVVGAGGHHCPVARAFGEIDDQEDVVVTQEGETRLDAARLRALTPRYGRPDLSAQPDFDGSGCSFS